MLKKIKVDELRLGMHLQSLEGAWIDHPFWRTQFVLRDDADLAALRASGVKSCWIDVSKGVDSASASPDAELPPSGDTVAAASSSGAEQAPARVEMDDEVLRAANLVKQSRQAVVALFTEARMGNALDISGCADLVNEVTASIWRNSGAMLSLARLKTHDDYTYMHSIAVCALMVALGRQLGLDEDRTREAGMAGLLHDLGKAAMPLDLLNKPGRLTDAEFETMRTHPERGHTMLLGREVEVGDSVGQISAGVLDVCLHHHERSDGTGYPHRLPGEQMSLLAKMSAVCDVYDAITSNRPYKNAWDPSEAIGRMASWRKGQFDEAVFQAFVRSLGIYPVGSLVRMKSDKLGVVIEHNEASITSPKVRLFYSARSRMPIPLEVVDLGSPRCSERIAGRESNSVWKFPHLDSLWAGTEALRKMGRS